MKSCVKEAEGFFREYQISIFIVTCFPLSYAQTCTLSRDVHSLLHKHSFGLSSSLSCGQRKSAKEAKMHIDFCKRHEDSPHYFLPTNYHLCGELKAINFIKCPSHSAPQIESNCGPLLF